MFPDGDYLGRLLIIAGVVFIIAGIAFHFGGRLLHLGHLPGDIHIEREKVQFYFPLATSLVLSIVITVLLNFFIRR